RSVQSCGGVFGLRSIRSPFTLAPVKRGRVISVLAIVAIMAVVAVVAFSTREQEPHFEGRPLSAWLAIHREHVYTQDSPDFEKAQEAVQAIGTNAVPFLLKWIRQEPPSWQRSARARLPRWIGESDLASFFIDGPGSDRASAADLGFGILGSNAVSAIPELTGMLSDPKTPRTAKRAASAMSSLGYPGFRQLTAVLADTNHPNRGTIPWCLRLAAYSVGTNACVPPLVAALNDPDSSVRASAGRVLGNIAPEALTNAVSQ
ncbi:MAG TPA: hypothetical protein VN673_10870, partial [Clostridia bacterium]|nr:hypothetical protein [Clostridia bacterium]